MCECLNVLMLECVSFFLFFLDCLVCLDFLDFLDYLDYLVFLDSWAVGSKAPMVGGLFRGVPLRSVGELM